MTTPADVPTIDEGDRFPGNATAARPRPYSRDS